MIVDVFSPFGCFSNPSLGNHSCIIQLTGSTNEAKITILATA